MPEYRMLRNLAGRRPWITLLWIALLWIALSGVPLGREAQAATSGGDRQPVGRSSADVATKRLIEDAADRRFDEHSLLKAALVAEGALDSAVFDDCNERLRRHQRRLQRRRLRSLEGASLQQRARVVHEFMHAEILTGGYDKHGSSVVGALRHGRFNCVSSSILFRCLCTELGLPTAAVETSGHVWMRLTSPTRTAAVQTTDVQTTVASWQDAIRGDYWPSVRPAGSARNVSQTRRPAREVGELELVAMIYYNRGVDLLHQRDYVSAAQMNRTALALDPRSLAARANLLASLNNRAVQLTEQEQYRAAHDVLLKGLSFDAKYVPLLDNDLYLHHQWIASLCRRARFDEVMDVLDAAQKRRGNEPFFRQTRLQACRRWAERLLAEGSVDEAFALFEGEQNRDPDSTALRQIESEVINDRAVALAEQQRLGEAIELLERAIQRSSHQPLLQSDHRRALQMLRREMTHDP
jgi:tetratricopeptide (TPR) repeat protein